MMTWLTMPFRAFAGFLRWWLGELAGLVPRALRRPFTGRRDSVILEPQNGPEGQGGNLYLRRGGKVEALGSFGEGVAALPAKARRGRRSGVRHRGPAQSGQRRRAAPRAAAPAVDHALRALRPARPALRQTLP